MIRRRRTGGRRRSGRGLEEIYQTGDGTQWTYVGATTEDPQFFVAVSPAVAVAPDRNGFVPGVRVTTDGGRTWQSYPTTMP